MWRGKDLLRHDTSLVLHHLEYVGWMFCRFLGILRMAAVALRLLLPRILHFVMMNAIR